jgi:hypothetical protein
MKKILLVSGCSFTAPKFYSQFHPDLDTSWPKWPTILAEKLDMDCINLAHGGAGNEYIYSSLLDKILQLMAADRKDEIGLIIPAWSHVKRKDYKLGAKWFHPGIVQGDYSPYDTYRKDILFNPNPDTQYNTTAGDTQFCINQSVRYYYSLQEICKSKKLPYKAFQMIHAWDYHEVGNDKWDKLDSASQDIIKNENKKIMKYIYCSPYFNMIDDTFIGWPLDKGLGGFSIEEDVIEGFKTDPEFLGRWKQPSLEYAISEKDNHPNAKGHEKIAEFLYDRLE